MVLKKRKKNKTFSKIPMNKEKKEVKYLKIQ
jgi:hypothetical protein